MGHSKYTLFLFRNVKREQTKKCRVEIVNGMRVEI